MSDPQIPFNCPRCGQPLTYVTTQDAGDGAAIKNGPSHIYTCLNHGQYVYSADGHLRGGVGIYGRGAVGTKH